LVYLPEEIGRLSKLKVLNLSSNMIKHLPYSISKLKELQALWLSENQVNLNIVNDENNILLIKGFCFLINLD